MGRQGTTFCDKRVNGGWTNPRFRIQQAAGLRTKALSKELEQRECHALPTPTHAMVSDTFSIRHMAYFVREISRKNSKENCMKKAFKLTVEWSFSLKRHNGG
jgi:hypothetical protein